MTVDPRKSNSAFAGHHRDRLTRATFEVFYKDRQNKKAAELAGWYWRRTPWDELTGEDCGPFTSSRAAYRDALNRVNDVEM